MLILTSAILKREREDFVYIKLCIFDLSLVGHFKNKEKVLHAYHVRVIMRIDKFKPF